MTQANGTHAKDIALYYLKITNVERVTPAIVGKTISQAKGLLSAGYSKEEITSVIDRVIAKGVVMYSFGYINTCINDVLREIKQEEQLKKARIIQQQIIDEQAKDRKEVTHDDESAKRNAEKARRANIQSRKRKKFDFDMFEGQ